MKKNPFVFSTMTRKETGKEALTAILGGVVCKLPTSYGYNNLFSLILSIVGSVLSLVGFILALVWLYRVVNKKP